MNQFRAILAKFPRKRSVVASSFVLALVLVVVSGNLSASQSSGTSVTTCYNKKTGDLRYLIKGKCKNTEKTLRIGKPAAQGPRGATGPAGPSGYSVGFSASGVFTGPELNNSQTEISSSGFTNVFNTGLLPADSESSSESFVLSGTKDVQVTANLMFRAIDGDALQAESGHILCTLMKGEAGGPLRGFTPIAGSDTVLDVSEAKADMIFVGSMTLIGWDEMSGSNDFSVKCTSSGTPSDVRVVAFSVNAIAIG